MATATEDWVLEHNFQARAQMRSRPGPVDEQGRRWMLRERTGLISYQCNCDYGTGWVPGDSVPGFAEAYHLHSAPSYSSPSQS